jgi:KipI family sensor histidine kinase inhibitor
MVRYQAYGDKAILISFSEQISEETNIEIFNYSKALRKGSVIGVESFIPAYSTIVVQYNPLVISFNELINKLKRIKLDAHKAGENNLVKIPVCYHEDFSEDMIDVMSYSDLTKEELILRHTKPIYKVHMIGFMPGFFYLGGLDETLFCPRKESPRLKIAQGSVGIGGKQTGVYPLDGPGGWQIIGRTPQMIFDKDNTESPFLVKQGDQVQFYEISLKTFNNLNNG